MPPFLFFKMLSFNGKVSVLAVYLPNPFVVTDVQVWTGRNYMAWLFCTKSDVISITPASESALEDFWSDTVEALIRRHMGMPHLGNQEVVTGELRDGDGTNILLVRKPPIISVQSVAIDGGTLMADEYVAGTYGIQLRYTTFPRGTLNVSVSYTSGSVEVDPILRLTAAAMIAAIYNYRNRGGADASIKWSTVTPAEGEKSPNLNVGLTSHLEGIMKRMLRRERVRVR